MLEKTTKRNQQLEKESLEEVGRTHSLYVNTLNEKARRLELAERELKKNEEVITRLMRENKYLRKKDQKKEKEVNLLKGDNEVLSMKLEEQMSENQSLKLLQSTEMNRCKGGSDSFVDTENSERTLEEELYMARMEIFSHLKEKFEEQAMKMEEAYQRKKRLLEQNFEEQGEEEQYQEEIVMHETLFKDQCVGTSHFDYQDRAVDTRE